MRRLRIKGKVIVVLVCGACCALVIAAIGVSVRTEIVRVDTVSASIERQTEWFGRRRPILIEWSPLADRLRADGISWAPDWRGISVLDYNLMGALVSRGCGDAPPIYRLRPGLEQFSRKTSRSELKAFVQTMQTGTEEEQQKAVNAAWDEVFAALDQ